MTEDSQAPHASVLLKEAIENLNPRPGGRFIDGTLGAGGHTRELLKRHPEVEVLGIDRDDEALEAARSRLAEFGQRIHLVRGGFAEMNEYANKVGWSSVDGILLDLGVSSMQLDRAHRGFSYRFDGPLDMRMDRRHRVTASMVLNDSTLDELTRIFRTYGEEPKARYLAKEIVRRRETKAWERTGEFAELVNRTTFRKGSRRTGEGRCFQALRIAVNDEFGQLERALDVAIDLLAPGGRLAIITFHSLEDRIVKHRFVDEAKDCICPPDFPVCRCEKKQRLKIITRKPIISGADELADNKRASSAKLRVAEKMGD